MEVILLERIARLGQMGDVVTVKNGFARNYLLPREKAMRATQANLAYFETQRQELEARNLVRREEAEAVSGKMDGAAVVLIRQAGETGQLYGSVNMRDVAEALDELGFKIERSQVALDRPIKTLGLHAVAITLHAEVSQTISVNIARSDAEAALQAQGVNVLANDEDEEEEAPAPAEEAAAEEDDTDDSPEAAAESEEEAPA